MVRAAADSRRGQGQPVHSECADEDVHINPFESHGPLLRPRAAIEESQKTSLRCLSEPFDSQRALRKPGDEHLSQQPMLRSEINNVLPKSEMQNELVLFKKIIYLALSPLPQQSQPPRQAVYTWW
jgi:hypothetical protein